MDLNSKEILIFIAILPVVLILLFIYNKDKEKEPIGLLIKFFTLGITSCFLVLAISDGMKFLFPFFAKDTAEMTFMEVMIYSFIGVALVEEISKWIMVYFNGYNNKEFDELYDIMVYSVFVSLGFAFFENILYVLNSGTLKLALLRAVSAVPGHACDAIFMGYYLSLAKECHYRGRSNLESKYKRLSIIMPAILHGIYDFCLMSGMEIFIYVFLIFVVYLYVISIGKVMKLAKANRKMGYRKQTNNNQQVTIKVQQPINTYTQYNTGVYTCRNCGTQFTGSYECPRCGNRVG